jgi:hypothetical protein
LLLSMTLSNKFKKFQLSMTLDGEGRRSPSPTLDRNFVNDVIVKNYSPVSMTPFETGGDDTGKLLLIWCQ